MSLSRGTYVITLVGYFGLLSLMMAWNGWLAPSSHLPKSLALLFFAGPLLLPLRGLLHGRPSAFVWASLLSLLYLLHGSVEVYINPAEWALAVLEILFSLMLYLGGLFFARFRRQELASE